MRKMLNILTNKKIGQIEGLSWHKFRTTVPPLGSGILGPSRWNRGQIEHHFANLGPRNHVRILCQKNAIRPAIRPARPVILVHVLMIFLWKSAIEITYPAGNCTCQRGRRSTRARNTQVLRQNRLSLQQAATHTRETRANFEAFVQ